MAKSTNTTVQSATVTRARRAAVTGHRSAVVWFTGLSGSGKSTLAYALEERLHALGCVTFVLDGDNLRQGLCADLGFSDADRSENIRRAGAAASLFVDAGVLVLAAFISPFEADRARARALVAPGDFFEVHCAAPLAVCEERDVKGLYKRARAGQIAQFTGISSPYEAPADAELVIATDAIGIDAGVDLLLVMLRTHGVIPSGDQGAP
jgi:adenylylsulfate kinase